MSQRARTSESSAQTSSPYNSATASGISPAATRSIAALFASAPTPADTSNVAILFAFSPPSRRVTTAPASSRTTLPSGPVAVDGKQSPASTPSIFSPAASNRPTPASAAACAHRTLAHALASLSACAARCSATASGGSASRDRPDATRSSPTSVAKSHAALASNRNGSDPCASTPSHSCAGGVRRPDTTSTALGECASVDANGAANNAAEIFAASIL